MGYGQYVGSTEPIKGYILMIKNPSKVLEPIVSILLAFLTGSLVIILIGEQPFEIFKMMFSGAVGSAVNISNTLVKTTTLTLAGLSYAFAYRCGLINIGAEGQMYIGALMAGTRAERSAISKYTLCRRYEFNL